LRDPAVNRDRGAGLIGLMIEKRGVRESVAEYLRVLSRDAKFRGDQQLKFWYEMWGVTFLFYDQIETAGLWISD